MDDPVARRIIQACADAGEQARLLPAVPMKMKLADQTTAMLPLTPTGTAGALVIRAPVIITALREYFEMLWDRATPLKPQRPAAPGDRLPPAQQAVLELMAEGLHDDAIARRAGISITTVRRHIAAIMSRLGRLQPVRRRRRGPAQGMDRVDRRYEIGGSSGGQAVHRGCWPAGGAVVAGVAALLHHRPSDSSDAEDDERGDGRGTCPGSGG